jgi:putative MATE family efflux protein
VLTFNIGSGILRAVGDSKRPLVYLIIGSAINIGMDFLLVVHWKLGVMGAALSTLTAQTIAASLLVLRLMRVNDCYRLNLRRIGFDQTVLRDAFRIGLPAGFQSTMYGISNVLIQGGINTFGTTTMAAWTAYGKIDSMFWMTVSAMGISVTTFVGQNFGARKMDRVRGSVRVGYLMAMGAALAISAVVWFFAETFLSIFTPDAEVIRTGARLLREITPLYFTYVSIEILSGALRGAGDSLIPMAMTVFGICGLRLFWLYVIFPPLKTMDALVFSYPVTWAATSLLFIAYYLRGGWLRRRQLAIGA